MISKATREKIDTEIAKYPQRRGALLPALQWIQAESGYVSPDATREAAEIFGIHHVEVMEVVRFYNMLYSEPQGRHHVHVCTNLPCSLRGARILLRQLETHLGVQAGETTPDGRITLGHEECLGACAYAPMMRVDSNYHEDLDGERAKKIVDALD